MIILKGKEVCNTSIKTHIKASFIKEKNMEKANTHTATAIIIVDNGRMIRSMERVYFTLKTRMILTKEDLKTIKNMDREHTSFLMAMFMREVLRMELSKDKAY